MMNVERTITQSLLGLCGSMAGGVIFIGQVIAFVRDLPVH
jgi:hypothetical protein